MLVDDLTLRGSVCCHFCSRTCMFGSSLMNVQGSGWIALFQLSRLFTRITFVPR